VFLPQYITLKAHTSTPLPSSALLQAHAALAKILDGSGMGTFIDEVFEERDKVACLAADGSSDIPKLLFAF
jgi:hypothetical protein